MRNKLIASVVLACSVLAVVAAPIAADARTNNQKQRVQVCHTTRSARNTGTVVGAVGGGLLGNALGHNTGSTLLGAGAGAVAGHEVAKHNAKKVCHWEYR